MFKYSPQSYSRTYKKSAPACLIAEGQKIATTTLDAHGWNGKGERLTEFSNPLTGPFLVENAQPGDTLVVKIDSICPLGGRGWSYETPRPGLLGAADAALYPDKKIIEWEVDRERGIVTSRYLAENEIKIPLRPMVGCVGVACKTGAEATSQQLGPFGGNLDFPLLTAGTQLELPVLVAGGYLFIGDVHAYQSAGEITGAAVEVPAEVEFSVALKKEGLIRWPRGETIEAFFTIGVGKPFEEAVQHALSEMICLLEIRYAIGHAAAAGVVGQLGELQICSLVSTNYSVACLVSKAALSAPV